MYVSFLLEEYYFFPQEQNSFAMNQLMRNHRQQSNNKCLKDKDWDHVCWAKVNKKEPWIFRCQETHSYFITSLIITLLKRKIKI